MNPLSVQMWEVSAIPHTHTTACCAVPQALEDAVRQTQMSYRTMQATVAEHTNMLYRQDRRGSHNGSRDREKEASASGGVSQDEVSGGSALDKYLASMGVCLMLPKCTYPELTSF